MKKQKEWWKALLTLGILTLLISAFFLYRWNQFVPVSMKEDTLKVVAENGEEGAGLWIKSHMKQYDSIFVPFSMRVKSVSIDAVEALSEPNFYQVDYTMHTSSTNWQIAGYLEGVFVDKNTYKAQHVVHLEADENGYAPLEVMRPVEYQIRYELGPQEPPQPTYAMQDKEETYLLQDEQLLVTYVMENILCVYQSHMRILLVIQFLPIK